MIRHFRKACCIFLFMFAFCTSYAQTDTGILSKEETDSLIVNYCRELNQVYFNKPLAKKITDTLQKKLKAGQFYKTERLTDHLSLLLRKLTNDIHFYIGVNSPVNNTSAATEATPEVKMGGLTEVKLINNNIGYIKWNEFIADDNSFQQITAALQFVKGCKYLIFDISQCPGGDGRMGGFMARHLFEDNDYQDVLRKKCTGEKEWHQSEVPYNYSSGPKFYDMPVFVITSKNTASAAEYFALIMQETKRGTLLGDTTAGAGNPITMVTFGNYFAYIPICEIVTREGKSIESKGVAPDVKLTGSDLVREAIEYIKNHP
jgi:hypothetical protein